ncbi:MAG: XRE family transcriptional regulator [Pseudomonadota bacterium]
MAGTGDLIGFNVKRIRAARDLSQVELAKMAGMSRSGLQQIEKGAVTPNVSTLKQLAEALNVQLWDLVEESPKLIAVRFRSKKKMRTREDILAKVASWLRDYNDLEDLIGEKQEYKLKDLEKQLQDVAPEKRPHEAAIMARNALGLKDDEVVLDICGLLESAGIKMFPLDVNAEGFFGLVVAPENGGPAIAVNCSKRLPVERWIFTAAHELGHLLLHRESFGADKDQEVQEQEDEANSFAGHFLMPDAAFAKQFRHAYGCDLLGAVFKLKRLFLVSYKTVLIRLQEMDIVNRSVWGRFNGQYRRRYEKSLPYTHEPHALGPDSFALYREPVAPKPEPSGLDAHDFVVNRQSALVRKAIEQNQITISRAAEILGIDLESAREWAASWRILDDGRGGDPTTERQVPAGRKRAAGLPKRGHDETLDPVRGNRRKAVRE